MLKPIVIVVRTKAHESITGQVGHSIAEIFKDKLLHGYPWEIIKWNMDAHTLSQLSEDTSDQGVNFLSPNIVKECIKRLAKPDRERPLIVLMEQATVKNVTSQRQQVMEEEKLLKQLEYMLVDRSDLNYFGAFGKLPITPRKEHDKKSPENITLKKVFALMIKGYAKQALTSCNQKALKSWTAFNAYLRDNEIEHTVLPNMLSYCSITRTTVNKTQRGTKNIKSNRSRRPPKKNQQVDHDYEYHWKTCDNGDSPNKWTWGKLGWYLLLFLLLGLFLGLIWLALYFRVEYCLDRSVDCGW